MNCSRRNPKRSAKYLYHTGTLALSTARAGTSSEKEERKIRNSSSTRWTSFQFLPTIKKGRPHGHRYDKKPGDKEYYIANQLKKKCKKRFFQGIHDRFIRDEQFRSRMIEIGRNEDLCRQMDDLADEDHTHHLTSQEYFYYIVYLAAIERKRRRSSKRTMGTKFFFFMVELARFLEDSFFL